MNMARETTRIPCSVETRDNVLKPLKGPEETYDDLLERLSRAVDDGDSEQAKPAGCPSECKSEIYELIERTVRNQIQNQTDDIINQTSKQTADEVTSRLR